MAQQYNTRIKMKRDTSANWTAADPVLLDGEIVIVDTASGSVRKKVGDGTKRFSQLPFDDEEVLSSISDKSDPSTSINATLTANGWSNGSQTLSVTGLSATQNGQIGLAQTATEAQISAAKDAMLSVSAQAQGTITIKANGGAPTCDIPVTIILMG